MAEQTQNMAAMSEPTKHHYLPVFYLTQWTGSDGKLTRYYRPHRNVVASRITPANTGYELGLYSLQGYQPDVINTVEKEYMARVVDEPASKAIKIILGGDYSKMSPDLQVAWTRFILSLVYRTPHMVDIITKEAARNLRSNLQGNQEDYEAERKATHPPTLLEFVERYTPALFSEAGKSFLPGIIDNPKIGNIILKMGWWTWDLDTMPHVPDLLTGDSPVFTSHGLGDERCVLVLPISPRRAFFAARNSARLHGIMAHGPAKVAKDLNIIMVDRAQRFVFGSHHRHLRFVENRLRRPETHP
jgi:hypothetical protein